MVTNELLGVSIPVMIVILPSRDDRGMAKHEYPVEVQTDFLERQTRAQPTQALAELIWNSLDADAAKVNVGVAESKVGGMESISISDNGGGIPFAEAPNVFGYLGGSWKRS